MFNASHAIGDTSAVHLPSLLDPEDSDAWHNPDGETRLGEILTAIVKAGYSGIGIDVHGKTSDDSLLWTLHFNIETPEGRLAYGLYTLVKAGNKLFPVHAALATLERVYREQNLSVPQKQNPGAPTPGSK
jgi:hypothetical protein